MRVGSLFSGIGGLDLGLERAGMTVVWQSEIDPYASRVLAKHWPDVPNLGDITTIDWSTVEPVDLICGGYPCQPFSYAGSRAGENDARHLWPYYARAIRDLRPEWALLENVPGHLSLGFGQVHSDLAELGYDTDWDCIPAAAVGAPHLRYRVFVVAHADRDRVRQQPVGVIRSRSAAVTFNDSEALANADTERRNGRARPLRPLGWPKPSDRCHVAHDDGGDGTAPWSNSPEGGAADFTFAGSQLARTNTWSVEPDVGRVAHGVPSRVDRLKCLGNAVVPQVAEFVGRRIMEAAA